MTSTLRLLLWLKWTLTWRGYRKNRTKVVGVILLLLLFLPVSVLAAWLLWFTARERPALAPVLARDVLAVIYVLWALTPLLGFQLNDSYDLTKLFVYPVGYARLFLGSVLGSLLDISVLMTLPTAGVLLALFAPSGPAGVAAALLLFLFLLHTLALGQAVTLALIGFLRSRRFRDITVVLFPLIGLAYYLGQRVFFQHLDMFRLERSVNAPGWRAFDFLPPGWAAAGLGAARDGHWGAAAGAALALAAAVGLTLAVAATTLKRLYLGDAGPQVPSPPGPLSRKRERGSQGRGVSLLGLLPADVAAMAGKEFVYLVREPQYKNLAVNILYTLVVVAGSVFLPATGHGMTRGALRALGAWPFFGLTGTLLLAMVPLLFNLFGGEGAAITVLFSFPTRRRALLLGKNVAHGCLLLGVSVLGLLIAAALTGGWAHVGPALALAFLAAPVLLAAGNLMSVRFPHRMLVRGQRWQKGGVAAGGGDGSGCLYPLLYLLAYAATFVALLPAVAAVAVPSLRVLGGRFAGISPLWYAVAVPLALAYAVTLYVLLLGQAEAWLRTREPEIAARIVPAD